MPLEPRPESKMANEIGRRSASVPGRKLTAAPVINCRLPTLRYRCNAPIGAGVDRRSAPTAEGRFLGPRASMSIVPTVRRF